VALRAKLPHVAAWNAERASLATRYGESFARHGLLEDVRLPDPGPAGAHAWHQYVIRVGRRDELKAFLAQRGIGSAIYYPLPLHRQPCFADLGQRAGDFPVAERASKEVLALPMFPGLAPDAIERVVESIRSFVRA
jgi:dTDP-4-amino-4,6-dideoxygalactose transaminase